jgi:uncharacterized membrane protein YbhN (UPF0104 family)
VYLAGRTIELERVVTAMRQARLGPLLLAGVLAVTVCMMACSLRLWLLTVPLPHGGRAVGFWPLTSIYFASSAAHHLLPAPAAEVLRTVHLKRRYGYSIGALVACQLVEKVIDSLGLGLETLVVASFLPLPAHLRRPLYMFALLTGLGVATVLVVGRRHARALGTAAPAPRAGLRGHLDRFVATLGEGMYLLRSPRTWGWSLLWSAVNDVANAASVGLVLLAVGVSLPLGAWFLLVLVARLAGLVPSTPGQFGVVEAGLVVTMGALGVPLDRALAAALLYHLAHFIPVTAVGLVEIRRQLAAGAEVAS